jgi:hypothetical protein
MSGKSEAAVVPLNLAVAVFRLRLFSSVKRWATIATSRGAVPYFGQEHRSRFLARLTKACSESRD